MAVTRDEIVSGAIALLDEAGLDGLTLRRLAERLGIRAPTLYWHVKDKRELLDLMADAIVSQALSGPRSPRPGQPWWDWLADFACGQRAALLSHRDSARVMSGNRPAARGQPPIEREVRALTEAGFTPTQAVLAFRAVGSYVAGEVLGTQAEADRARLAADTAAGGPGADGAAPGTASAPGSPGPGAFPPLRVATGGGPPTDDERFEYGLGLFIAGLRAQLNGQRL